MTPNFKKMKKHAEKYGIPVDVDQTEKDWDAYIEIEHEAIVGDERKQIKEKRYKKRVKNGKKQTTRRKKRRT